VLELQGVTKAFGPFVAVRDVSLAVEADEIRCVIGPNGAGKTTVFNLIAGELRATAGHIRFDRHDITRLSVETRARRGIARSFQTPRLCERLSVFENVRLAAQVAAQSFNPLRR